MIAAQQRVRQGVDFELAALPLDSCHQSFKVVQLLVDADLLCYCMELRRRTLMATACVVQKALFTGVMGSVLHRQVSTGPHPENASFGLFSSCSRKPSLLVQDGPSALLQVIIH